VSAVPPSGGIDAEQGFAPKNLRQDGILAPPDGDQRGKAPAGKAALSLARPSRADNPPPQHLRQYIAHYVVFATWMAL